MASAISLSFPSLRSHRIVRIPADETWIAPAILDRPSAEVCARDLLLPHLAHRDDRDDLVARLAPPTLLYVPFWRVKLAVPAIHLASSARNIAIGNIEFPMPIPSYGGRAGVLMVCARKAFPYTPSLPSLLGGNASDALEVQRSTLLPMRNDVAHSALAEGEILDADVDRELGERTASETLAALLRPPTQSRVRSVFNPRVESTVFVRYPLYLTVLGNDDEHFLFISARDGSVVSARFPRAPTISERVKRLFG